MCIVWRTVQVDDLHLFYDCALARFAGAREEDLALLLEFAGGGSCVRVVKPRRTGTQDSHTSGSPRSACLSPASASAHRDPVWTRNFPWVVVVLAVGAEAGVGLVTRQEGGRRKSTLLCL